MILLKELEQYLSEYLSVPTIKDYCPNGVQVQGRRQVVKIVCGVTACLPLIEHAASVGADAILVHHGYFWKGEDPRIIGMKARRIEKLFRANLSLLAYHLPLDVHPEVGNNVALGEYLGWPVEGEFGYRDGVALCRWGRFAKEKNIEALSMHMADKLGRDPLVVAAENRPIKKIGWCTGGAQGFIEDAVEAGVDLFVTGEVSEQTVHIARENNIHFISAGHHATERYGIQALGNHLADRFGMDVEYVDIDNPA